MDSAEIWVTSLKSEPMSRCFSETGLQNTTVSILQNSVSQDGTSVLVLLQQLPWCDIVDVGFLKWRDPIQFQKGTSSPTEVPKSPHPMCFTHFDKWGISGGSFLRGTRLS